MSVEIQTSISRSIPSDGVYRVEFNIVSAVGISLDVLVFDTEHVTYSHVCTVYDLETYPVGREAAQAAGLQFYRARAVTTDWATINDATAFETVTTNRLKVLSVGWNAISAAFSGSEIVVIDSGVES